MLRCLANVIITTLILLNTYYQFKAKKLDKRIRKQYTIYFKVMCIFLVLDNLLSFILRYVLFYQLSKCLIVLWLSFPQCSGAVFVYRFYVNKLFVVYEKDVDRMIVEVKQLVHRHLEKYYEMAYGTYKNMKNEGIKKVKEGCILRKSDLTKTIKNEVGDKKNEVGDKKNEVGDKKNEVVEEYVTLGLKSNMESKQVDILSDSEDESSFSVRGEE